MMQFRCLGPKYADSENSIMNNSGELNLVTRICQEGLSKIASEIDSPLDTKAMLGSLD